MKIADYELGLAEEGVACADRTNPSKKCSQPAVVVLTHYKRSEPLCEYHFSASLSGSSILRDHLLTEMLKRALKQDEQT